MRTEQAKSYKTTVMMNYRKCFRCGAVTENMKKNTCECGCYMYQMGGIYVPKTKTAKQKGAC